ncbi:OppA family ABC transporter substrate-binding lipoprotein [Mycoplasma sp. 773]
MKKANKILLASLPLLSASVPLLLASCSNNLQSGKVHKYVFEYNSPYTGQAFVYDASRSYGGYVSVATTQQTSAGLVRIENIGEPVLTNKVKKDQSGKIIGTAQYITTPTWTKKALAMASAVVITDKNGSITTFDSDDADIMTEPNGEKDGVKYYTSASVELKSNNQKSINSFNFDNKLKSATKVQFIIRKGVFWVDETGKKTKYEVNAKDFYYSWLRTLSVSQSFRDKNGGSEELDKEAAKVLSDASSSAFTDKEEYSNDYLFSLFGIDHKKFSVEKEFIQKVGLDDAVTFEKISNHDNPEFTEFFNKLILRDYTFQPAPSQYIDEKNQTEQLPVYNYNGLQNDETKKFEDKIRKLDKNSIVYKVGAYWYGVSLKNTLYNGAYYISPQKGQELILKKNKNYYDQKFVNSPDTIEQIVFIYNQNVAAETFADRIFNKYKEGSVSQIAFSQLNKAQQDEILRDGNKFGLRYIQVVNTNRPFYRNVAQPFVRALPQGQNNSFYEFNDAFAKLVYGATRDELSKGLNDPSEFISGRGLIFRTLINAAINWDEFASQATSSQSSAWIAKVADGSPIGGNDQQLSKFRTPNDVRDRINSLFALKADESGKIDFGTTIGKEISPSENEEVLFKKNGTRSQKLESAGFEKIKEELKKLIDNFYEKFPEYKDQDIEFKYAFPFINIPKGYKTAFESIQETFSQLHPKLKLSIYYTDNKDDPRFDNFRSRGSNGSETVSWSYDYDSIGSGYDGLSFSANLVPTLTWIAANDSGDKNKLIRENYPKIYKLAKDMVEYANEDGPHKWIGSVPFADLHLVENKYKGQYLPYTTSVTFEKRTENGKEHYFLKRDSNNKAIPWTSHDGKHGTDAYAWTAAFWLQYIAKHTNEQAIELMEQFTSFFNIGFTYAIFKQKNEFGRALVEKKFVVPDSTNPGVDLYVDWKIKN